MAALAAAPAVAFAAGPPPPGSSRDVVANGTFESGVLQWQPVGSGALQESARVHHGGTGALEVRALAHADAGAYTLLQGGAQPGLRYTASGWVRGDATSAGKWFRLQLNETGGAAPPTTLAGAAVQRFRLGTTWRHVTVTGRVRSAGRTNVTLIVVLEKAPNGARFYADDVHGRSLRSRLGAPLVRFSRRIAPEGAPITVATPGGRVFLRAFGGRPRSAEVLLAPAYLAGQISEPSDARLLHVAHITMNQRGYGVARFSVPRTAVIGTYATLLHCGSCATSSDAAGLLDAGPYPDATFEIVPPAPTPTQRNALLFGLFATLLVALGAAYAARRTLLLRVAGASTKLQHVRTRAVRAPALAWIGTSGRSLGRRQPLLGDLIAVVVAMLFSILALTAVLHLHALPGVACASTCAHLNVPFAYAGLDSGGDSQFFQMVVKAILDHGWFQHNASLGAPAGQQLYDFPLAADNFQYALIKGLGVFSSSSAVVMNLYFILTFPLTVLTAFIALRLLGVRRLTASVLSILYAFAPYHILRGETHLPLAGYYAVPLALYLVLAVGAGRPLFARSRRPLPGLLAYASGRTFATLVICALVGSTGLYYAAFALVLLCAAAAVALLRARSLAPMLGAVVACLVIVGTIALEYLPTLDYRHAHGLDQAALVRTPQDTEWYSLRLADLVLPIEGHRIGFLAHVKRHYTQQVANPQSQGEAAYEPLGVIGTVGFAWLLAVGLITVAIRGTRSREIHRHASFAVIVGILVATTGGVSTLIAYYVTPSVRGWNRMSIVIEFLSLLAVGLLLDRFRARWRPRGRGWPAAILVVLLLALGLFDQTSPAMVPQYGALSAQWRADDAFVQRIQAVLPRGAAVFQFPYVPFIWTPVNKILPYDPVRGYLHSQTLRWSFGAMRGRPEQDWQPYLYDTPLPTLLDTVAATGFDGIWIDRNGYTDSGKALEKAVEGVAGARPLVSADKRFVFFDLRPFAQRLHAKYRPGAVNALKRAALEPLQITPAQGYPPQILQASADGPFAGFDVLEQSTLPATNDTLVSGPRIATWRWMVAPSASMTLTNPATTTRSVLLQLFLQTIATKPTRVDVTLPDGSVRHVRVTNRGLAVTRTLLLKPGASAILLDTHGPVAVDAATGRRVYLRVAARVTDAAVARFGAIPPMYGCAAAVPVNACTPKPLSSFPAAAPGAG